MPHRGVRNCGTLGLEARKNGINFFHLKGLWHINRIAPCLIQSYCIAAQFSEFIQYLINIIILLKSENPYSCSFRASDMTP